MPPRHVDIDPFAQPSWVRNPHLRQLPGAPRGALVRRNLLGRGNRSSDNLIRRFRDHGLRAPPLNTARRVEVLDDGTPVLHHVHHHIPRPGGRPNAIMLGVGRHPNFQRGWQANRTNEWLAPSNVLRSPLERHPFDRLRRANRFEAVECPLLWLDENDRHRDVRNHHSRHRRQPRRMSFVGDSEDDDFGNAIHSDNDSFFEGRSALDDSFTLEAENNSVLGPPTGDSPGRGRRRFRDRRTESILRDESSQSKRNKWLA